MRKRELLERIEQLERRLTLLELNQWQPRGTRQPAPWWVSSGEPFAPVPSAPWGNYCACPAPGELANVPCPAHGPFTFTSGKLE